MVASRAEISKNSASKASTSSRKDPHRVVVAIAVGAALPVWVLSRLAVIEAPSGSEVLGRELDQIVARHQVEAVRDSGERFADSPRY